MDFPFHSWLHTPLPMDFPDYSRVLDLRLTAGAPGFPGAGLRPRCRPRTVHLAVDRVVADIRELGCQDRG